MKKLFILSVMLVACNKPKQLTMVQDHLKDDVDTTSFIYKTEVLLGKADHIEDDIKSIFVENKALKTELKTTKDSLKSVTKQLVETRLMVPKKQGFIQKLFKISPDSVAVVQQDTIIK